MKRAALAAVSLLALGLAATRAQATLYTYATTMTAARVQRNDLAQWRKRGCEAPLRPINAAASTEA